MKKGVDLDRLRPRIGNQPSRTGLKLGLLIAGGICIGLLAMTGASMVYKNSLLTRVNSIAESLDTPRVTNLKSADDSQAVLADGKYLREKLARIKAVNPDSRFVYLMARNAKGEIYFLADSEPEDSPDYSAHGEVYPEASSELKSLLDKGEPFVEGPVKDSYGSWLSALAPVVDDRTYRMTAIVGMDVPATTYILLLGLTGGIPILLSLLAAIILYARHQSRRHIQENIQFRAEMLSIASHELRTPLTGLRWSQESVMSHKLPPAAEKRAMEIMYDSTLRLQESIEDILQLANMEAGKYRLYRKDTDLREMMLDIVAMQRLAADRMSVKVEFSPSWPEKLILDIDKQRLKRVFHNLLSNAIKYSRPDTTIIIGYGRSDNGGHVISFQDHGIGIPAAEQTRVWDGFYRASNTTAHDINGTGMGLYLARHIIEQHGGRTWLESVEGQGTTVYSEIPDTPAVEQTAPTLQTRG
jgi:signal transduction histidine kinase